ncbi:MAG TPA: tetratricopeptide repeat protein, partial [Gammaproteobacteria bacterium]
MLACLSTGCGTDDSAPDTADVDASRASEVSAVGAAAHPLFEDGLERFSKGDFAGAIIQFRNVIQLEPTNPTARIEIGRALNAAGDPASAEHELREAIRFEAHPNVVSEPLGVALLHQSKFADLDRLVRDTGGRSPTVEASMQLLLANAYVQQGDRQRALEALDRARKLDPRNIEPLVKRADIAFASGDNDAAKEAIRIAEAIDPESAQVWAFKGRLSIRDGDYELALENYERASALDRDLTSARAGYARALVMLGRVEDA